MAAIRSRRAVVGVIGLGYVGLPLALAAVEAGFPVLGFDINPARVEAISAGRQVINYLDPTAQRSALDSGRFSATTDFTRLAEADAVILCVPTPVTRNRDPDLSYVRASAASAAAVLRPGQLVVLESTTWPGTTAEVVRPLLEAGGLAVGEEVFLAFSPEREDPGNAHYGT
ncbi:MAG: nucleotide sugar dehydrogenase, partial [Phenylobacterium sp.]|nr:nucleotide sugar dehydrogenase [Phenylobacterium sp.]